MSFPEDRDEKKAPSDASSSGSADTASELPLGELSERRLLRKLDWHILPLISIIHLLSFL
jgi:hypothetical protein